MSQSTVFGIRHHGPGCARSVRAALDELKPDVVALEGPADAEIALPLVNHDEMIPPVSMLIYPKDEPRRSVSFPLTDFSPEWQVLKWAGENKVPVRLMDLPMSHRLALDKQLEKQDEKRAPESPDLAEKKASEFRADPIALLAEAAGYADHELWWEEQIERREDATGLFEAILEAMQTIREEYPETRESDLLREAFMRKTIRKIRKETVGHVAIVCGAWHSPVLTEEALNGKIDGCKIKDDTARLKGLPKLKTTATWIPWTHSRLSYRSGYGAGVDSPGWYSHIWESPQDAPLRWLTNAARLLREKDLDASSASVIEASRLAETLAALRDLRSPGLRELNESILTVFCQGDDSPLRLIRKRLEIGDKLGSVPDETPSVPLAENLAKLQKSLRMKPSTEKKLLDLDLRKEIGRERSHLLHRLNMLEVSWGVWEESGGGDSTFHEIWQLEWQPEFAVAIIEANVWGNTVELAATHRTVQRGRDAQSIQELTELLHSAILADLQSAIPELLEIIRVQASVSADVRHLMEAVLPLARIARYSDVRKTEAANVLPILDGMFDRILVGLISACLALDDSAAETMLEGLSKAQQAIDLLGDETLQSEWNVRLRKLLTSKVNGLLRGWACRLLLEKDEIEKEEFDRLTRLELSPVTETSVAATWLTGLLKGSGLLLVHQETLWEIFDEWLRRLKVETFVEMLPVLRRAFSDFNTAERRQMGEKVKFLTDRRSTIVDSTESENGDEINHERAAKVLPVLTEIMGGDLK
ncbi:DUF5682 family protein [Thalassoglobus polymorphus]|uniref:Uncharacterized protein n=1 Tax=Thalassoglobus polymorphus TaxID=2527994 RepID=A0A517QM74_9PLAN|nr:DUF5682 family protein [Thalassoglobus polymorphus]QDT32723.1 hypothetical protein Mal48_19700 [Thalassoglobus polymorphus]